MTMPLLRPPIRYLNTDLDLSSKEDLRPLARVFQRNDMYALNVGLAKGKFWRAHFEANGMSQTPNGHIAAMLKVIESLKPKARGIWDRCETREFNLGYDSGFRPIRGRFSNLIPTRTLLRMANLGLSIRITIYPPDEEGPPPESLKRMR